MWPSHGRGQQLSSELLLPVAILQHTAAELDLHRSYVQEEGEHRATCRSVPEVPTEQPSPLPCGATCWRPSQCGHGGSSLLLALRWSAYSSQGGIADGCHATGWVANHSCTLFNRSGMPTSNSRDPLMHPWLFLGHKTVPELADLAAFLKQMEDTYTAGFQ